MTRRVILFAALAVLAGSASPAAAQGADSLLAAACESGGGVADGLLVVVFRSDLPAAQREALAREVGGRVAGPAAEAGLSGYYVVMPPEGRSALDAAADRLIRHDGVQEVGGAVCPAPPPPPAAADTTPAVPAPPGDTGAAAAPADTAAP